MDLSTKGPTMRSQTMKGLNSVDGRQTEDTTMELEERFLFCLSLYAHGDILLCKCCTKAWWHWVRENNSQKNHREKGENRGYK